MKCDQFLGAIDPYLDEELSIIDSLRMHGHLLLCKRCRQVIGSETTLHALLVKDGMADQPSDSLRERIIREIRRARTDPDDLSSPDAGGLAPGSRSSSRAAGASPRERETDGNHTRPRM
jgi:putative zinc finger protein